MKIYTKESLIQSLQDIRAKGWIETDRTANDGNIGNLLEDLLGITENNLPIPNAAEWELKAQKKNTPSLLTLFHLEPSPTSFKFVTQILLPEYGWEHKEQGKKYPVGEKSFRQTIRAGIYSNRGFTVHVNRAEEKIEIRFSPEHIDQQEHAHWYKQVKDRSLSPAPYWGFNDFYHKIGTKLHNCFYITADSKRENGKNHFKYEEILMLRGISRERTIDAIENGAVYVDFDARTGHNHGTKFRISRNYIKKLYDEALSF